MAGELRYSCKVVIVTGGTRGIGEAITRLFVRQGACVVFCALECERERGVALQRELEQSGCPGEALFVVCDVRCEEEIKNLISVAIERYGRLDTLVNNAAIFPPEEEIDHVTAEGFRVVIDTNVLGYFLIAKYGLPYVRKTKGNVINISSIVAKVGYKHAIAYTASKGAIAAMTKAMALDESKYGVRVNCILPGNIWTPMWQRIASESPDPQARIEEGTKEQALRRLGTAEEVALAALFLAAEGTFCTGSELYVTGGAELGFGNFAQEDTTKGIKG